MSNLINRQILLAKRPKGWPDDSIFRLVESPIPNLGDGEVLVRTVYLFVDPYMRGRMNDAKSYTPPFELDEVLTGGSGRASPPSRPYFLPKIGVINMPRLRQL